MAAHNGGRVTTAQFYEKMMEMEERMIRRLDALNEKMDTVTSVQAAQMARTEILEKRTEKHETENDYLQQSDRKWGAFSMLVAAIGSIIAGIWGTGR